MSSPSAFCGFYASKLFFHFNVFTLVDELTGA